MDAVKGGQALKERRLKLGYTMGRLSERCGVAKPRISELERGKVQNPGLKDVVRVSRALGLSADEVVALYEI